MQKWEYFIIEQNIQVERGKAVEYMNQLGEQGWEVVAATSDDYGHSAKLVFKPPKT
jgi:hypothetical protein